MVNQKSKEFYRLRSTTQSILASQTPYRKGNLRSTIRSQEGFNTFEIVIGGEQAPYVYFVNERRVHPRWRGRQNPREGFIHRAAGLMAQNILMTMNVRQG